MDAAPPPAPPPADTEQQPATAEEPPQLAQPPAPQQQQQQQQQPAAAPTPPGPSPPQHVTSSPAPPSVPELPASTTIPSTVNTPQQPQEPRPQFQTQALARGGGARPPLPTFSHFHSVSGASSPGMPPSVSAPIPRGVMAIGHPAHQPPPRAQQAGPVPFSSFGPTPSFGQTFGGMHPRGSVCGIPDQPSSSNAPKFQSRGSLSGVQPIGMVGSLSTGPQMRPGGLPMQGQSRPGPAPVRSITQPQGTQAVQQPWMSIQGKATPSPRPQTRPQCIQQRPHTQQRPSVQQRQQQTKQFQQPQLQPTQQPPQRQEQSEQQQQTSLPNASVVNQNQQTVASKNQQLTTQQPPARSQGPQIQRSTLPVTGTAQPSSVIPLDATESGNQILSKRSIHELVSQVDPTEKLDPEVEDILVEIADDFIESITTVACSLAKHRKSNTLEARDILLHLEKNWNITLPGFGGDEIKCYKKPSINEIHKDRLVAIRKSMVSVPEPTNVKSGSAAQTASTAKGHTGKAPPIGSPKLS